VNWTCPFPVSDYPKITLAHGGGGRLTAQLVDQIFRPAFASEALEVQHDGAVIPVGSGLVAFTTDSFVVKPLFFPGGDIGGLAVNGSVNDLLMCGARPAVLSLAFILEEGLETAVLIRIVESIRAAAATAGVKIVTGDTKVVEHGRCDGLYINVSGLGWADPDCRVAPGRICTGDLIILSGDIGRHGIAVLSEREGLAFEGVIGSDCASLAEPVLELLNYNVPIHCLRDLTRGGLATALIELATASGTRFELDEARIPIHPSVRGACEILGLDTLYVANEGRFIAIVPAEAERVTLEILRRASVSRDARVVGRVADKCSVPGVVLTGLLGEERPLDLLTGEQLPRIC
jgi:hydrogenase expression/formation protein HypE